MAKTTICFMHDSNAKDDPKCALLIDQMNPEGYGIYWILIEILREQPEFKYPLKLVPVLARKFNTTTEKILVVIKNYDLFEVSKDEHFFSISLLKRMEVYKEKIEKLKNAGKISAQKRLEKSISCVDSNSKCSTNVEQMLNMDLTNVQLFKNNIIKHNKIKDNKIKEYKNNKTKESKEEKNIIPPTLEMIKNYCVKRENNIDPDKFFNYYESNGWKVGKNPMKNWQSAIINWEKNNTQIKKLTEEEELQQEIERIKSRC